MVNIAINGFGRIGRLVLRTLLNHPVRVVAINDLVPPDNLAYLFRYDSTHGAFPGSVNVQGNLLQIDQQSIRVCAEKDPTALPWRELDVDVVIESTGLFTTKEKASAHLTAGAKRVIISAPTKSPEIPTLVVGVNHRSYRLSDSIVSNASCTTNCLAPMTKVILDHFGFEEGLMTTVHAMTATQPTVDGPSHKDWRGGRGAFQNVIPASTGAAHAVGLCIPEVRGKLTGMAFRVPVPDVSVVDLTVRTKRRTSYREICDVMAQESQEAMRGIIEYCDQPVVSSDIVGSTYSCVFDAQAGIELNSCFFKLIAWYDNEMGYSSRIVDLLMYMMSVV